MAPGLCARPYVASSTELARESSSFKLPLVRRGGMAQKLRCYQRTMIGDKVSSLRPLSMDTRMNLQAMRRQSVPLYIEVATLFRRQIHEGHWQKNQQLPPLKQIMEDLGISRVTARQAMSILEAEGLIARGSGKGTFVKDFHAQPQSTLRLRGYLASLISMVEGSSTALVTTGGELVTALPRDLASDRGFFHMQRVHSLDNRKFSLVDLYLRSDIYDLSPDRFQNELAISLFIDLGVQITSARQTIEISSADMNVADLLNISVNSPIFKAFRVFRDQNNEIIYCAEILYRGDFLSLEIEFD
jgi:GntR family transcriptional regulator